MGYKVADSSLVCKLNKSIYGLRQASRKWFSKLTSCLNTTGCKQSLHDYSLFTYSSAIVFVAVVIYVYDILIAGNDMVIIQSLKKLLDDKFSIKNLGSIK